MKTGKLATAWLALAITAMLCGSALAATTAAPKLGAAYTQYIAKHFDKARRQSAVCLISERDLDGDGNKEVLVKMSDKEIYAFRSTKGKVSQLGKPVALPTASFDTASAIRMQESDGLYLHIVLTNEAHLRGFALLKVENDALKKVTAAWSPTGAGEDRMVDADGDGRYDGYRKSRWSYDVLFYPTESHYDWYAKKGYFTLVSSTVDVGKYPANPSDLVRHYLALRCIDNGKSKEVTARLQAIDPKHVDVLSDSFFTALKPDLVTFDKLAIDVNFAKSGTKATAVLTTASKDEVHFDLVETKGKWQIAGIQVNPDDQPDAASEPIAIAFTDAPGFAKAASRYTEHKEGIYVRIDAKKPLQNVELVRVQYESDRFEDVKRMTTIKEIAPKKPLVIRTIIPEGGPNCKIAFTLDGVKYAYVIGESGQTGEPLLIAIDPKTGKTLP